MNTVNLGKTSLFCMKYLKDRILQLPRLIYCIKDRNLAWQISHQEQELKLKHERILAEHDLAVELTKKNAELAHTIAMLKTQQSAELSKLKTRCKQDIKDYEHYLESLTQLKISIQKTYSHLPDAIIHTIHHHAKSLLNSMWETDDLEEKLKQEAKFVNFMMTLHQEASLYRAGKIDDALPTNTLLLINQSSIALETSLN